jgi:hypothetical protein
MTSAFPNSLNSSPNSGLPRQRTCQIARVGFLLPSNSIDSSFSRNVAKPLGAIFGSLMTKPVAVTTRGELPSAAASRCPAVLLVRKSWSRKNPAPTMAYVSRSFGQQAMMKVQNARAIAVAVRAAGGGGKISAVIIPTAAINARPTNGWRGALRNFMRWRFRLSRIGKASRNRVVPRRSCRRCCLLAKNFELGSRQQGTVEAAVSAAII